MKASELAAHIAAGNIIEKKGRLHLVRSIEPEAPRGVAAMPRRLLGFVSGFALGAAVCFVICWAALVR